MIIGALSLAGLLFIGLPVGLLVAAEVYDDATGCGSVDPTDPANYSDVTLLNDTSQTVVIDDCSGEYCRAYDLPVRLRPGQSLNDQAACAATGADMTSWRVRSVDGKLLGYVAVDTPRKRDGEVFLISKPSTDRTTPTRPGDEARITRT